MLVFAAYTQDSVYIFPISDVSGDAEIEAVFKLTHPFLNNYYLAKNVTKAYIYPNHLYFKVYQTALCISNIIHS